MRQATSMPMTSASSSARPEAPRCSANAKMADATGAAGWMMVFRWVSSKSKVCDVMPLSSAALAMSSRSERPSTAGCGARSGGYGAGSQAAAGGGGGGAVGGGGARDADGAGGRVEEGAHGWAFHRGGPATAGMGADEARQDGGD